MKHKEIPQDKKIELEQILLNLEANKYADPQEGRHRFRDILIDLTLEHYYTKDYYLRYKNYLVATGQWIKKSIKNIAGIVLLLSSSQLPLDKPQYLCSTFIKGNELIEETYKLTKIGDKNIYIPFDKKVIKVGANINDLKSYKCDDKN